jgi:hypothetical protein
MHSAGVLRWKKINSTVLIFDMVEIYIAFDSTASANSRQAGQELDSLGASAVIAT